jgi:hypothetical protein
MPGIEQPASKLLLLNVALSFQGLVQIWNQFSGMIIEHMSIIS